LEVWKRLLAFAEVFSDSLGAWPFQQSDFGIQMVAAGWRKHQFAQRVKGARRANLRNT